MQQRDHKSNRIIYDKGQMIPGSADSCSFQDRDDSTARSARSDSVTVEFESSSNGGCCVVHETLSKQTKLAVGDKIISVNCIAFDGRSKLEEGARSWMHLLQQHSSNRSCYTAINSFLKMRLVSGRISAEPLAANTSNKNYSIAT